MNFPKNIHFLEIVLYVKGLDFPIPLAAGLSPHLVRELPRWRAFPKCSERGSKTPVTPCVVLLPSVCGGVEPGVCGKAANKQRERRDFWFKRLENMLGAFEGQCSAGHGSDKENEQTLF